MVKDVNEDKLANISDDELDQDQSKLSNMLNYFMNMQQKIMQEMGDDPANMSPEKVQSLNNIVNKMEWGKVMGEIQELRKKYNLDDGEVPALPGLGGGATDAQLDEINNQLRAIRGKIKQITVSLEEQDKRIKEIEKKLK